MKGAQAADYTVDSALEEVATNIKHRLIKKFKRCFHPHINFMAKMIKKNKFQSIEL